MYLAMAKYLSDPEGYVTDRQIEYYKSLAEGGTGLIIPGAMIIDPEWPSVLPMQAGLHDDKFIPGLKKLADAVHKAGAKIFFQPWHPGQVAYTPGKTPKTINELTKEEIKDIQNKYFEAAKRVKAAGADGIEYQMCHNYIGAQFLSPHFNKRQDEYGVRSIEDQTRFSLEVIQRIKEAAGNDFPISVKINGSDFVPDGITPELAAKVAPILEQAGVSMLSVSGGGSETLLTGMSAGGEQPEGWKVPFAQTVKAAVKKIPVAATDSIRHPDFADQCIKDGKCDMIGMGRGLLAEHEWVNKAQSGKEDEMRNCISCMYCFNYCPPGNSGCSVNPFALREYEKTEINKDGRGRVVAIAGAGPAGLEAAVTLAERGFKPVIFEKESEIGGMVRLATVPPDKYKLGWQIEYYKKAIDRLGIEVKLNTEATEENLKAINPYAVVVASGSLPIVPAIPGIDKENVLAVRDVLTSKPNITGQNIVVIGSGLTGVETAEMFKEMGNKVIVVEMLPAPDPLNTPLEQLLALGKAQFKGVEIKNGHKLIEIQDREIIVEDLANNKTFLIPADYVVLSIGVKSNQEFYKKINRNFTKVYNIGDSDQTGKIVNAVLAGSKLGYEL